MAMRKTQRPSAVKPGQRLIWCDVNQSCRMLGGARRLFGGFEELPPHVGVAAHEFEAELLAHFLADPAEVRLSLSEEPLRSHKKFRDLEDEGKEALQTIIAGKDKGSPGGLYKDKGTSILGKKALDKILRGQRCSCSPLTFLLVSAPSERVHPERCLQRTFCPQWLQTRSRTHFQFLSPSRTVPPPAFSLTCKSLRIHQTLESDLGPTKHIFASGRQDEQVATRSNRKTLRS
jgi:hypothetical protein